MCEIYTSKDVLTYTISKKAIDHGNKYDKTLFHIEEEQQYSKDDGVINEKIRIRPCWGDCEIEMSKEKAKLLIEKLEQILGE